MRVGVSSVGDSRLTPGFVRLAAHVRYESFPATSEEYWYEVPEQRASDFTRSGNPWLAALLPLAASLGEPIEWEAPVDRPLVDGAQEILRVWHSWYGQTRVVPLRGPVSESPIDERGSLTASFLTCGVDSMFTALDHGTADGRVVRGVIDEFLFVHGFDVAISDSVAAFRVLRSV
jgi:hypothetical protein